MANRDAGSVTVEDKRYSTLPEVRGRMMGNGSTSQRDRYHPLLRGGTETVPTEPEFPIEMEDNHECAYIYEDQWPLYGDYDMNDRQSRSESFRSIPFLRALATQRIGRISVSLSTLIKTIP